MLIPAKPSVSLHNGPFHTAQQLNERYLLSLDPEKLLAPYYRESGLKEDAERYGNWENSGLDGHTLGHVLSAAAHSAHATGNAEVTRIVENLVSGLKAAQDHLGTGYVGGIPHGVELWERIFSGNVEPDSFGLNGAWVPWYNLHKLFAGLIDAHRELGNPTALDVVIKLADWWVAIARTMPDDAFEAMLRTEFGAMNAAYADLYELTGNEDYAWLAKRFTDRAFYEPLLAGEHKLPGMHANTQIAKAFGYARVGHVTGDRDYLLAAANLWKLVVDNHTYIFGGNSTREHFTESLHAGFNSEQGPETCNTYNMLRLTNQLLSADAALLESAGITVHALLDYYERALFNHILPSQHPQTGGLVYFTPVRPDQYRVYSTSQNCFWCCVGTGIENHARYTERLFTRGSGATGQSVQINFGIAARAEFADLGMVIETVSTVSAEPFMHVRVVEAPAHEVTIKVRLPWWSRRNNASQWHEVTKVWEAGEEIRLPLANRITAHIIEPASNPNVLGGALRWVAFQRGPQVLVSPTHTQNIIGVHADDSRMGHAASGPIQELSRTPMVVADQATPLGAVDTIHCVYQDNVEDARQDTGLAAFLDIHAPTAAQPAIALSVHNDDGDGELLALQPLADTHESRYTMYFPLTTAQDIESVHEHLTALDHETLADLLFTLDAVIAGEQQPESDHGFDGISSYARSEGTLHWRDASTPEGFFSYVLKSKGEAPAKLSLLVAHQDTTSDMTVTVNGQLVDTIALGTRPIDSEPPFVHDIALPEALASADTLTVVFATGDQPTTPRLLNVRLLK